MCACLTTLGVHIPVTPRCVGLWLSETETRDHSTFAETWAQAREDAVDMLEAEARRRALATSDALLMFLLKSERPEKFREKVDIKLDLRREAERIATSLNVDVEATIAMAERLLAEGGAA